MRASQRKAPTGVAVLQGYLTILTSDSDLFIFFLFFGNPFGKGHSSETQCWEAQRGFMCVGHFTAREKGFAGHTRLLPSELFLCESW